MLTHKMRPAWLAAIVIVGLAILTLTFSPTVRAAVQSIFSFNGVEVSVDSASGNLITDGNTDAILYQDENTVLIQGDENELAGVSVASVAVDTSDTLPLADALQANPNFVLPTHVPDGYTLNDEVMSMGEKITVSWTNAAGDVLSYSWGASPLPNTLFMIDENGEMVAMDDEPLPTISSGYTVIYDGEGNPTAILNDIKDGIAYSIYATDATLTEAALRAMVP